MNAACWHAAAGAGHRGGNRLCTHSDPMKAALDPIQDPKVGEKADRLQRDVQERDHEEGGFLPYGVPWPARDRTKRRLFSAVHSTADWSYKTWKSPVLNSVDNAYGFHPLTAIYSSLKHAMWNERRAGFPSTSYVCTCI